MMYKILDGNDNLRFKVPLKCSELKDTQTLEDLKINILSFIDDYVRISKQYGIGEILGEDFCIFAGCDYLHKLTESLLRDFSNGRVSIFGDIAGEYSNRSLNNYGGTKLFYYDTNRKEYLFEYIYDVYDFKNLNDYLKFEDWGTPVVKISSFSYSEKSEYLDSEELPIYFDVGVCSNIFYNFIEDAGSVYDNSIFAFRNSLRYNSYIRNLTDIWVNKYRWEIEWLGSSPEDYIKSGMQIVESAKGIFLSGEIKYYEDLQNGKLKIPELLLA